MKNIIIFVIPGLARVISSATPLLALLIFSKLLSTEEIGLVSYFIAIITLLGILTEFKNSYLKQNLQNSCLHH